MFSPKRLLLTSALFSLATLLWASAPRTQTAATATPAFRASAIAETGLAPYDVELADVDGDGDIDAVTSNLSNQDPSTVSVLKNTGDGTFLPPVHFAVGPDPTAMRLADFNGDGRPDIVCIAAASGNDVNDLNSFATVLMNDGTGSFAARQDYPVGENANSTAVDVGDYDGDGRIDFAIASYQTAVYVYRNTGNGSFAVWTQLGSGMSPGHLASADFNGDGRLDLLIGNTDAVQVNINTGSGFTAGTYIDNYPDGVRGITTGDFDNDGKADFAATGRSLSVYRNLGAGASFAKTDYRAGESQTRIKARDMDGDGKLDLTVSNYLANSVSVYSNDGSGAFADRRDWGVGQAPNSHAIGDVNADGKPDLVVAASQTSQTTVNVVLNAGNRFYVARRDYGLPGAAQGVDFADFNHDGYMDAVSGAYVSNQDGPVVFYGKPGGSFQDGVQVENWGNNIPTDVAVGDFNADGWADFATSIFSPGNAVRVNLNRGDGTFHPSTVHSAGGNPSGVAVGDVNGDGKLDIVNSNGSQLDNSIHVFLGIGDGTFRTGVRVPVGFRPGDVLLGDFDQNGRAEVLVTHYGSTAVYYFKPDAAGMLAAPEIINVGNSQGNAVAADFDNDGWVDVMAGAGNAVLLRNNQTGSFHAPIATAVPAGYIAAGDWDRDGLMDVVGTDGAANLALVGGNRGGGTFEYVRSLQSGYETARAGAADLDGDGMPEIVVCNLRARSLSVFQNTTAAPLAVVSAVSRKTHGTAGTFDIALPLSGTPGIESRSGGSASAHQIIVTFSAPVTLSSATVKSGSASVGSTSTNGSEVIVNLQNVADAQTIEITLENVSNGSTSTDVTIPVSLLIADTNANRAVTASDIGQTKAASGQPVTAENFRTDVNANGSITASDIGQVKANAGHSLP